MRHDPIETLPPHSEEAEMSLLGCLLHDPTLVGSALDASPPEAFYGEHLATIYRAMVGLYRKSENWDGVELLEALRATDDLDTIGGVGYLTTLAKCIPGPTNHPHYSRVIAGHHQRRRLIEAAYAIIEAAHDTTDEVDELAGKAESAIIEASGADRKAEDITIFDAADQRLKQIEQGVSETYPTGIIAFDKFAGGLPKSGLVTITGASGHGKSTAVIGIVEYISRSVPVRMFSFEMPALRIAETVVGIRSGVNVRALAHRDGHMDEWSRITTAHGELINSDMVIADDLIDARQIHARCYRYKSQGVGVVVIDYLQNLPLLPGIDNQFQSIVESAQTFQRIARKMGLCIVLVCQATAEAARRNKVIGLSDAYGGIVVQQVTDLGISIYRPHYATGEGDENELQIHVVKNKYGPVTSGDGLSVNFDAPTGRITERSGWQ